MDYAAEIYKLITNYLPLTDIELGVVSPVLSVDKVATKVILEVDPDDYTFIKSQMTNENNYSFTTSGFRVKNRVISLSLHPQEATQYFGFLAKFEKPINKNNGNLLELKGFADNTFNNFYIIVRKIDDYNIIIAPVIQRTIIAPIGQLGFCPEIYANGLNGVKILSDEGSNSFSFEIDDNLTNGVDVVGDIDLTIMPNIWFYQKNILKLNFQTFLKNLTNPAINEYLVIDTTSLVGVPLRGKYNNTDAPYANYSSKAFFSRNYSLNIKYLIQRNADDIDNQTQSGSDIVEKQSRMFDALTSIITRPLPSSNRYSFSSVTITDDVADTVTMQGSVIINYTLNFTVTYLPESILDVSGKEEYGINKVKYNTDEIIV